MKNLLYTLIALIFFSFSIVAQEFSERKVLIDDLGARIEINNTIHVEDVVYCKIMNDEVHFISHMDEKIKLYKYTNGQVTDLGDIGELSGFIVDVYDYNSDGLSDILGHFQIKLGETESSFGDEMTAIDGSTLGRIYRTTDFNGDGVIDIMKRHVVFSGGNFNETIYIYLLNNNNQIESTISFLTNEELMGAQIFDHNMDGNMDFAYLVDKFGDHRLVIQTNNGDGTFTEQNIGVLNTSTLILAKDFDNDSDLDILITGFNGKDIEIVKNENGSFTDDDKIIDTERIYSMHAADFNMDGNLDLSYLANESSDSMHIMVAFGRGDGNFDSSIEIGKVEYYSASFSNSFEQAAENWMSICDYDMDGDPDIMVNAIVEQKFLAFENIPNISSADKSINVDLTRVFPNPASSTINIDSEYIPKDIEVLDLYGHILLKKNNTNKLDISALHAGLYFLRFTNEKGQTSISNFIKKLED